MDREAIDSWFIRRATGPSFGDIFNYEQRATKRLLRRALRLADCFRKSKSVCDDALALEVWMACMIPVMQGYWRSPVPEDRRKRVLDEFHRTMLGIVVNDVLMESRAFQKSAPESQELLYDKTLAYLTESMRNRADEYIPTITDFLTRDKRPNAWPRELTTLLVRNLFGEREESNGKWSADYSEIMIDVALPMIAAYVKSLRG